MLLGLDLFLVLSLKNSGGNLGVHVYKCGSYCHLPVIPETWPYMICTSQCLTGPASHFLPRLRIGTISRRAGIRHSLHQLRESFQVLLFQRKSETQLFLGIHSAQGHPAWRQPTGSGT